MNQDDKARSFAELHVKGSPVILYNVWDAGSAKAVCDAGAKAIATGSWSVAGAQGFNDGEAIPLDFVEQIVARIVATVAVPVTVDFEGGYAQAPDAVAANVERIINTGAIGINFEDRVVSGEGLYAVDRQQQRISAIRRKADALGIPLVINARTDLFLQAKPAEHATPVSDALTRANAYRDAGASSFFVPGLIDERLIADVCDASPLPVNIMMMNGAPSPERLAEIGVARISYGPGPFRAAMSELKKQAQAVYA